MANLLVETVEKLIESGKSVEDVQWVGCGQWSTTWAAFAAVADFVYDDGFGGQEVRSGLRVVGKDWWLERAEYDGSEWWEFKTLPTQPQSTNHIEKRQLLDRWPDGD